MILRITQFGEPILREPGKHVERFDDALATLVQNMTETMHDAEGVGIAAQQVGLALRLFIVDLSMLHDEDLDYTIDGRHLPLDLIMPLAVINPELSLDEGQPLSEEEGCLSFPGVRGDVPRAPAVSMHYQDLQGVRHHIKASGWFARVLQHEYDHIEGQLFTDRMEARQQRLLDAKLKRLKRAARDARSLPSGS